jgi:GNAT superfamily N-acetyltransferase
MCPLSDQSGLRPLDISDRPAFLAHLLRLGPKGRYSRFSMTMSDAAITAYAEQHFKETNFYFGYFDRAGLRGVVEAHCMDRACLSAELAFSIELGWRGQGLGKSLFEHAMQEARKRGVRFLHIHCLAHNFAMLSLIRTFGGHVQIEDQDASALITL